MADPSDPRAVYETRLERFGGLRDHHAQRSRLVAYARLAAVLPAGACLVAAITAQDAVAGPLLWAGGALLAVFAALVVYHGRVDERRAATQALWEINHESLARLARDWRSLPAGAVPPDLADHPYAADLDVFGRASLAQLVWPGGTETGRLILSGWLLAPAPPAEIADRQEGVRELAPLIDLRQSLAASARISQVSSHDVGRFLAWAEGQPWLLGRRWAIWTYRGLAAATALLIGLHVAGLLAQPFWLAAALVNLIVTAPVARHASETFNRAFAHQAVFARYADLARLVAGTRFTSPLLVRLQTSLASPATGAPQAFRRLHRLMALGDLRHSALLHLPVQALTLWDVHVLVSLERWQARAGPHARTWVNAIGTIEALGALAGLVQGQHPAWTFPQVVIEGTPALEAAGLGHPLIRPDRRVGNDVRLGPPGTFLLVTGSNMSGKSTLLRAIGLNVVLAQAGGPVCATSMRLPAVRLATSMRIGDSLEEGLSYFMAALRRLKDIVDAARAVPAGGPAVLLYLLDEVLGGTNTAERQIAVRRILRHLVNRPAIGAVTTHDLSLADTEDLAARAVAVHFTETLGADDRGGLNFDYMLRPGIATSRNALKLMELVGLGEEGPP